MGAEQETWEMLGAWEGTGGSLPFCWALHPHKDEVTWWQQPLLCLSLCFLNAFFFSPGELRKT